ncbi:hypothetical protein [Sphingomonas turrisvirgatae]|nr:hypothetical protein [Sphingomonas turrisvirgatae]
MLQTIMVVIVAIYVVSFLTVTGIMVSELPERPPQDDIQPAE